MATETPNHKLIKPEMTDKADISMINPNWDTLDTALKAVEDRVESTETSVNLLKSGQLNSTLTIGNEWSMGSARLVKNHNANADFGLFLEDIKDDSSTTRITLDKGRLILRFTKADGTSKSVTIGDASF